MSLENLFRAYSNELSLSVAKCMLVQSPAQLRKMAQKRLNFRFSQGKFTQQQHLDLCLILGETITNEFLATHKFVRSETEAKQLMSAAMLSDGCDQLSGKAACENAFDDQNLRKCRFNMQRSKCETLPEQYRLRATNQVGGDASYTKYQSGQRKAVQSPFLDADRKQPRLLGQGGQGQRQLASRAPIAATTSAVALSPTWSSLGQRDSDGSTLNFYDSYSSDAPSSAKQWNALSKDTQRCYCTQFNKQSANCSAQRFCAFNRASQDCDAL